MGIRRTRLRHAQQQSQQKGARQVPDPPSGPTPPRSQRHDDPTSTRAGKYLSAQVNKRGRGQSGCSRPVLQRGGSQAEVKREESSARLCVDVDGRAGSSSQDSAFRKPRSRSGSSGLQAAAASSPSAPPLPAQLRVSAFRLRKNPAGG